jgi:hypothetical protein
LQPEETVGLFSEEDVNEAESIGSSPELRIGSYIPSDKEKHLVLIMRQVMHCWNILGGRTCKKDINFTRGKGIRIHDTVRRK